jgi:release factor glutamine methyltransferase
MNFILNDDTVAEESQQLFINEALERLVSGEPLQYITGEVYFDDLLLKTDSRALIPRPETEELVHWIAGRHPKAKRIMDVCTGSGCIALALKNRLPEAELFGSDWSDEALALAIENRDSLKLDVHFLKMDALADWKETEGSFDIIVSNPPYIPKSDDKLMLKNVLEHEPHMALFVEDSDPLIFYRKIAEKARLFLNEGGHVYYEVYENFHNEMIALMEGLGFKNVEIKKDLQNKSRMLSAQSGA